MDQALGRLIPDPSSAEIDTTRGRSAASWGAIIAGAAVAISSSLILLALGSGLGFASISAWPDQGVSAKTFTVTTAIWLIVTQWFSAALGGYIAGRLRTRWVGTHTHEVFFRDTAHGLVTWSVATVLVSAVLAASAFSIADHGVRAAGEAASSRAQDRTPAGSGGGAGIAALSAASDAGPQENSAAKDAYDLDKLFRADDPGASISSGTSGGEETRFEAARIVAHDLISGSVPDGDRAYLASLVAARIGIPQPEAAHRVDEFIAARTQAETDARAAAESARKGAAEASIFTALSLLVGAFIASVSAALGGRLRDDHP